MKSIIFLVLVFCSFLGVEAFSQESEKALILSIRQASNEALKAFDEELNNSFMTDDVLLTTGAGMLISGKKGLANYTPPVTTSRMYWIRTPDEVIVNPDNQLAWESGTWKGYVEGSEVPVVGGKYAAQWTKKSGTWLIQSQLFVTLPN